VKRLALFLVGAFVFFELAYALADRRMFFGTGGPAPVSGVSERPAVEAALARLDAALVRFYADGDEGALRALLADPDGPGSPLAEWRSDRVAWAQAGPVPALGLEERRLLSVGVSGLDVVTATAAERWAFRADGGAGPGGGLVVRYTFRRAPAGLLRVGAEVTP